MRFVRVVVAALLAALLIACRASEPEPVKIDPAVVLVRAAEKLERASTYRFLLEFDGGGSAPIARGLAMRRAEGTYGGPDRLDAVLLASAGPIDARVGVRVVGGESWMTNPLTGLWEPTPLALAQLFDVSSGVTALIRGATNPRLAAEEPFEGVSLRRVEATLPSERFTLLPGVPPGQQLRATAWVGRSDDLVRRLEVRGRGAPFAATADAEGTVRLTLSRFDEPVAIGPPP